MPADADLMGGAFAGPHSSPAGAGHHSLALSAERRGQVAARLARAVRRARRSGGEPLASISMALPAEVDPSEVVCASRRADEPWFLFEQPDRGRAALAGLGEVACLQGHGPDRFAAGADRWRARAAAAVSEPSEQPPGSGPVALGGFAFAEEGGRAPHWQGFEPASLSVPEVLDRKSTRL